jgi:hypothetical protein
MSRAEPRSGDGATDTLGNSAIACDGEQDGTGAVVFRPSNHSDSASITSVELSNERWAIWVDRMFISSR